MVIYFIYRYIYKDIIYSEKKNTAPKMLLTFIHSVNITMDLVLSITLGTGMPLYIEREREIDIDIDILIYI